MEIFVINHNSSSEPSIMISLSSGYVSLFNLERGIDKSWKAHDFEAWIASFHGRDSNIVFSGIFIFFKLKLRQYFCSFVYF